MEEGGGLRSRFRGALLGVAVGDAIGAPFEGEVSAFPGSLERLGEPDSPLRYTDDTHMTLGVAESLVQRRGFDGAHMAAVFARNYAQEPWRGYGAGPRRSSSPDRARSATGRRCAWHPRRCSHSRNSIASHYWHGRRA